MAHVRPASPGADGNPEPASDGIARAILASALALGCLRLFRLRGFGLWIDEAYTWSDLNAALGSEQIFNPLGYRLIGATVALLGGRADEVSLRLLPALAGILCVGLTAFAFRPLVGARRAALAALFLAVSPWHLFWSQSARFYTFAQAVSLLGTGLLLRGLFGPGGARGLAWVLAGVLGASLAACFHPTAAFLLPGLVLGALAAWRFGGARPPGLRTGTLALLGCAALGMLVFLVYGLEAVAHHQRQKPASSPLSGVAHLVQTVGFFFTPWWLVAAAFGFLDGLRRREPGALFALLAAATPFALALALATRAQMTAQYVFLALPWVALLAALPLRAAGEGSGSGWLRAAVGGLVLLPTLSSTGLYFSIRGGERAAWREAYRFVEEERRPGDMVLGMGSAIGEFYLGGATVDLRRPEAVCDLAEWFPDDPRRWTRRERRIWVVVRPQWLDGFRPLDRRTLERWLEQDCRLVRRFAGDMEGRDLDVLVYLRE